MPTAIKHAVLISDVHLGYIVDDKHFAKIVARIHALQPDIVLIAGNLLQKISHVDYGYKRLPSSVQVVVSSGVGFRGPPMRITKSEIVSLKLK